jgi:hypothetical protein
LPYEVPEPFPSGVQTSYSESLLSNLSCIVCYDEPYTIQYTYSSITRSSHIEACKSTGGSGRWIAMGSKSSSSATSFDLIAFIAAGDLVQSTSLDTAYGPKNGVYWYYYNGYSVGFASSSSVSLEGLGDTSNADCTWRLSWKLNIQGHGDYGGWRSGCNEGRYLSWIGSSHTTREPMCDCPMCESNARPRAHKTRAIANLANGACLMTSLAPSK